MEEEGTQLGRSGPAQLGKGKLGEWLLDPVHTQELMFTCILVQRLCTTTAVTE